MSLLVKCQYVCGFAFTCIKCLYIYLQVCVSYEYMTYVYTGIPTCSRACTCASVME